MKDVLAALSWIDYTALGIILVFVILGFFRGLLWQVSRLASLLVSFWLAGRYAAEFGDYLQYDLQWFDGDVALYVAYFAIFIAVLVVLSLITMLLDKLLKKLELKFYDYLGGGLVGFLTGGAIVIALLGATLAFAPEGSGVFRTANASETARVSRRVLNQINPWLPEELRDLFPDRPRAEQQGPEQQGPEQQGTGEGPTPPVPNEGGTGK